LAKTGRIKHYALNGKYIYAEKVLISISTIFKSLHEENAVVVSEANFGRAETASIKERNIFF
jgi:hypothetical protein